MIAGRTLFRLGTLVFGAALVLGSGATAYGQGNHSHRKQEKRAEKRHQKAEKEALKRHQREEREYYGNDREVREHQRREREELKRHRRAETRERRDHRRDERDGRYDDRYERNDGYYGDGGYSNSNRQAVMEAAYREGLRAGRNDRARNRQYDYERHQAYRNASSGSRGQYGDADAYREGFRRGYDEGYRDDRYRTNSGGGWGEILGGILGRP